MSHWLDGVSKILASSTSNLKHLAKVAGVKPDFLFQYVDFTGCDLRGQDLRGLDFTGSNFDGALIDRGTLFDPEFDPRKIIRKKYLVRVNKKLLNLINSEAAHYQYTYAVWFAKWLCEVFEQIYDRDRNIIDMIVKEIPALNLWHLFECHIEEDFKYRSIQLPEGVHTFILNELSFTEEDNRFSLAILLTILYLEGARADGSVRGVIYSLDKINERAQMPARWLSKF